MKNAHIKFLVIIALTSMTLLSMLSIGICLWTAWTLYVIGAIGGCVFMCLLSVAFITYQGWVILKNKSDVLNDLKNVWSGKLKF